MGFGIFRIALVFRGGEIDSRRRAVVNPFSPKRFQDNVNNRSYHGKYHEDGDKYRQEGMIVKKSNKRFAHIPNLIPSAAIVKLSLKFRNRAGIFLTNQLYNINK